MKLSGYNREFCFVCARCGLPSKRVARRKPKYCEGCAKLLRSERIKAHNKADYPRQSLIKSLNTKVVQARKALEVAVERVKVYEEALGKAKRGEFVDREGLFLCSKRLLSENEPRNRYRVSCRRKTVG